MKKVLEIEEGSPIDYEELVVYIVARERPIDEIMDEINQAASGKSSVVYGNDSDIILLHKEEGPDKVKVKFLEGIQDQELAFDDLIQALQKAKETLLS